MKMIRENPVTGPKGGLHVYGTAVLVNIVNAHGAYSSRNFQNSYFPEADEQSGERLTARLAAGAVLLSAEENPVFQRVPSVSNIPKARSMRRFLPLGPIAV